MDISFPVLILNFKTYKEATGEGAVRLAQIAEHAAKNYNVSVFLAVQTADLFRISQTVHLPLLAQHTDPDGFGTHTGAILPEAVKAAGAAGTLLNHAEKPLSSSVLEKTISRSQEAGLLTVVCAPDEQAAQQIAYLKPDIISVEPPELIASGVAVSAARPELVSRFLQAVRQVAHIPVLCGAGIRTAEDVRAALELGTQGVLLASGYCLAKEPKVWLENLLKGF